MVSAMTDNRKTIKVTIPEGMVSSFNKAKESTESEMMVKLSDTQYASRLIHWAILEKTKKI